MKNETDIVFVVLVYRNYLDLYNFCESLKQNVGSQYRVVVVDAYYDDETSRKVQACGQTLNCEYIQIQNKGYGFGNNRGIEYAFQHFNFKYLVVCNPDIELKSKIDLDILELYSDIIAPQIIAGLGKEQNPYWAYENKLSELLIYEGYKKNKKKLIFLGVAINKLLKILFKTVNKITSGRARKVYACHGSFVIFRHEFFNDCGFLYDEDMFLFYEEAYLALVVKQHRRIAEFAVNIVVNHKEDGSMSLDNVKEYPLLRKSYMYYYEKYRLGS